MAVLWKNWLIALLGAGGLIFLGAAVRSWIRRMQRRTCDASGKPIQVESEVPDPWRELWEKLIALLIYALGFVAGAALVWSMHWGTEEAWNGGAWKEVPAQMESVEPEFEVHESNPSWMLGWLGAFLFSISFLSAMLTGSLWKPRGALCVAVIAALCLWMIHLTVESNTREVRLSRMGLEDRSFFNSRRIPWEELGGLELNEYRVKEKTGYSVRRCWDVKDRDRRIVLSLPYDAASETTYRAMRARITWVVDAGGSR